MDKASLVQQAESVQQLLSKYPHKRRAKASELILLDQFIQIDAQQFEHQAEMLSVNECILQPEEVMVVVLVEFRIELPEVSNL
jgi:hypothetical protein